MFEDERKTGLKNAGKAEGVFYFKHFKVEDNQSTMKVGTDAVLLGAVADVTHAIDILEVGTGCGIIALIMAQRSSARIDAIEIDPDSARQAAENVKNSRWHERIRVVHQSFQDFSQETGKTYDLIISNPPYFSRSLKSADQKRNLSRHNDTLSFSELSFGARGLLRPEGSLWIILPVSENLEFIDTAYKYGLFPHYHMKIFAKIGKPGYRSIFQFKQQKKESIKEEVLVIRNEDETYAEKYRELTRDFYLDF